MKELYNKHSTLCIFEIVFHSMYLGTIYKILDISHIIKCVGGDAIVLT